MLDKINYMINQTQQPISTDFISSLKCTILIVDDSEADRVTYRRYLQSANNPDWNIIDCESAEDALQLCYRDCPEVILLDYILSDINGLEFLQDLTEHIETLPLVIMMTGQGNERVAVEAMKHGARDYLIKDNITAQNLVATIVNALTEQKLRAQIDRQRQQRELFLSVALQISHLIELPQILQTAVDGARELLGCDRTVVYQLLPNLSGIIVAEAVLPNWSASLGCNLEDICLQDEQSEQVKKYLRGHKMAVADIEAANLTDCHAQMLRQFQVQAVLAVPILLLVPPATEPSVWGLLIAHHCQAVHEWQADELNLLDELSIQMAIGIQQADLITNLKATVASQQTVENQLRDQVEAGERTNVSLARTSNLLQKRNQELDDFSHIASHDLQAPLRGISNLADWLVRDLGGQLPEENQHQLELIQSRVVQMTTLIHGLLQYALVGKEQIDPVTVNINELLTEVVDLLAPPTDFTVEFAANLPRLNTQALLLKQVLSNLIGNAIKYRRSVDNIVGDHTSGKVKITVVDQGSFLLFTVVDNGLGIAPENHQKIFGIFQTLVGRDHTKGMGIGLAVIKKIVESQGGTVQVESQLGEGSTFSFTWPKT
jgi:signal transduction histidine kinase/FixJ family two-component response regulator